MNKSFDHHQGTALSRQDIAKQVLLDSGYKNFAEFELDKYDENMEIDVRGIDGQIEFVIYKVVKRDVQNRSKNNAIYKYRWSIEI